MSATELTRVSSVVSSHGNDRESLAELSGRYHMLSSGNVRRRRTAGSLLSEQISQDSTQFSEQENSSGSTFHSRRVLNVGTSGETMETQRMLCSRRSNSSNGTLRSVSPDSRENERQSTLVSSLYKGKVYRLEDND